MTKTEKVSLDRVIADSIQKHVNGKIDKIYEHLKQQDTVMEKHVQDHAVMDERMNKHIEKVEPYIEAYEGTKTAAKGLVFWSMSISTIAAVIIAFKEYMKR